jgi:hypothetical protein
MSIILATWEAKIRRTAVWSQPRQKVPRTLSQKHPTQNRAWWSGSRGIALIPSKHETLSFNTSGGEKEKKYQNARVPFSSNYICDPDYCLSDLIEFLPCFNSIHLWGWNALEQKFLFRYTVQNWLDLRWLPEWHQTTCNSIIINLQAK